jgi:hypothetical protein
MEVQKEFLDPDTLEQRLYTGTVVKYRGVMHGEHQWRIVYEDGDSQDLSNAEIALLRPPAEPEVPKKKRAKVTKPEVRHPLIGLL